MSNILCVYYTRSGKTRQTMEQIAGALDAELVEINDDRPRGGKKGYIRCAMDAVRKSSRKLLPFQTEKKLEEYDLVILGTPVWAGRCSSVMRSFLKYHGVKIRRAALVITRSTEVRHEEVYLQMDHYLTEKHCYSVSLRPGDAGYDFWLGQFVKNICNEFLAEKQE